MQAVASPVRRPTALLPPTAVIRAQMEALQRNDYPEVNAGIKVAFDFAKPQGVEEFTMGKGQPVVKACRTWEASERYLSMDGFELMLRQPMYSALINCTSWEISSALKFHGRGDNRAVQAVKVTAPVEAAGKEPSARTYSYTFCMERIETGAYKGCWLTVGLRLGDYTVEPPNESREVT
ncbi:hypothetical protein KFL_001410060 [Klebsormidium nitens]|uniref:Uncharacterized protein n=1 Tax=Klebsormidium nitens TaxID=105231 RepID=A0A0U9HRN3_KLENI|nr:hypothetical protein KFL_001410060 [Klebsormidium nitens]|eukprot:GAQ83248.1 hypothetical protein KFL_001410060 [Klebsormidium nitens]